MITDLGEDYDDYDELEAEGASQERLADARMRGYLLSPQDAHARKHPPVYKRKVGNVATTVITVSHIYLVNNHVSTVC